MIESQLNILLEEFGAAIAHVVVVGIGADNINAIRDGLRRGRQYAGIGYEIGSLERNDRIFNLSFSTNGTRRLSSVTLARPARDAAWPKHGNIAAVGMPDQREMVIVRVGFSFFNSSSTNRILASPFS